MDVKTNKEYIAIYLPGTRRKLKLSNMKLVVVVAVAAVVLLMLFLQLLPACASEQGNVIGSVRICNSYTMVERDYR